MSRCSVVCCSPSSISSKSAPCAHAALAVSHRRAPIHVGESSASKSGSSPTYSEVCSRGFTRSAPAMLEPPYPRDNACTERPGRRARRRSAIASVTGVFPVPPTSEEPTQTTGTGARKDAAALNSCSRVTAAYIAESGRHASLSTLRSSQKAGWRKRVPRGLI